MVVEFQGEYRWLSNFWPVSVTDAGVEFPSVEHAYQAAKCDDEDWIVFCANHNATPELIKKRSKTIDLRPNWDEIKMTVMYKLLQEKYKNPRMRKSLLATGRQNIQEGNRWGDEFWGVNLNKNPNVGENWLGRMIMQVRTEIRAELRKSK